eukprot:4788474-Prymnesium_polylepis.2
MIHTASVLSAVSSGVQCTVEMRALTNGARALPDPRTPSRNSTRNETDAWYLPLFAQIVPKAFCAGWSRGVTQSDIAVRPPNQTPTPQRPHGFHSRREV